MKGGKWFSLMDKVYAISTLEAVWKPVAKNKGSQGIDGMSIKRFQLQKDKYLIELHEALRDEKYYPLPVGFIFLNLMVSNVHLGFLWSKTVSYKRL